MRLFARRRTAPVVRQPVPTPADVAQAAVLRRAETTANPALTDTELLPMVPVRGSYTVTYNPVRGQATPEPISLVEVTAGELEQAIAEDMQAIEHSTRITVVVDLDRMCGLVRVGGISTRSFTLARVGGAR